MSEKPILRSDEEMENYRELTFDKKQGVWLPTELKEIVTCLQIRTNWISDILEDKFLIQRISHTNLDHMNIY